MSRSDPMGEPDAFEAGRSLWRRARSVEIVESETERFLDLAAFADGRLDEEEHARVAAQAAADPAAASDIAAARAIADSGAEAPAGLEAIVHRAVAVLDDGPAQRRVVAFPRHLPARRLLQGVAQWGSLAAALVVASWLGFAMGSGASLTLSQPSQISDESFLPELLDPSTGFLRDLAEGQQT